jgi:hypothetical protein
VAGAIAQLGAVIGAGDLPLQVLQIGVALLLGRRKVGFWGGGISAQARQLSTELGVIGACEKTTGIRHHGLQASEKDDGNQG